MLTILYFSVSAQIILKHSPARGGGFLKIYTPDITLRLTVFYGYQCVWDKQSLYLVPHTSPPNIRNYFSGGLFVYGIVEIFQMTLLLALYLIYTGRDIVFLLSPI